MRTTILLVGLCSVGACSLFNAPGEPIDPPEESQAGGTPSGGAGSSTGGSVGGGGAAATRPPFPDFFIQDVCELNGVVAAVDPYDCAGYVRRDIALDEPLSYHLHDRPQQEHPFGHQMTSSVPYRLADGSVGVLHRLDFGDEQDGQPNGFREFGQSADFHAGNPSGVGNVDGYDLLEHSGALAAYVGRCDGAKHVQPMWTWPSDAPGVCSFGDAWIVASTAAPYTQPGSMLASLRVAQTCPQDYLDKARTEWELKEVTYSSGKVMESLVSTHYGSANKRDALTFERFYYTREYGRARWEVWSKEGMPHSTPCDGDDFENGYVRVECRDWTYWVQDPDDGLDPRTWPVDLRFGRGNRLHNGDFGAGLSALGPWQRLDEETLQLDIVAESAPGDVRHNNHHLSINWTGNGARMLYQDVPADGLTAGTPLGFGGRLWTSGDPAAVTLGVQSLSPDVPPASAAVEIVVDSNRQRLHGAFNMQAGTTTLRFVVLIKAPNIDVQLDDMWLAEL